VSRKKPGGKAPAPAEDGGKSVDEYAQEYRLLAEEELPTSLGFSARLNLLWDLSGAAPPQTEGRTLSLLAINRAWKESDVRDWLQRDVLPPRLELRNMVHFLVNQLPDKQDVRRWEAFLIYGAPIVPSPVDQVMYREDETRRNIATMIFAQITDKYQIPAASYDADRVFQRCLSLMHKFNIYELKDFQPGHLEPFRNYLFPGDS
jgi:hypothetical protein